MLVDVVVIAWWIIVCHHYHLATPDCRPHPQSLARGPHNLGEVTCPRLSSATSRVKPELGVN